MRLKAIEFDLPYQKNVEYIDNLVKTGLSYEDSVKKDYNDNWMLKRRQFQLSTRCMSSMVERLMIPIENQNCWKLSFDCTESKTVSPRLTHGTIGGVFGYNVYFDFFKFHQLNQYDSKVFLIDFILKHLCTIEKLIGFKLLNLKQACNEVIGQDYNNTWVYDQKYNKNKMCAKLLVKHEVDNVNVLIEIYNNVNNLVGTITCYQVEPDEWAYAHLLGRLKWLDKTTLAIVSPQKQIIKTFDVSLYCI